MAKEKNKKSDRARPSFLDKALIDAVIAGDVGKVSDALGRGADPKSVDEGGFTALMWAARYDLAPCAQVVMGQSDLAQEDSKGRTALMIAEDSGGKATAALIRAYANALSELGELSRDAQVASKGSRSAFRL